MNMITSFILPCNTLDTLKCLPCCSLVAKHWWLLMGLDSTPFFCTIDGKFRPVLVATAAERYLVRTRVTSRVPDKLAIIIFKMLFYG